VIPVDFGDWPGRIVFGVGAVSRLSELVGRVGGSRALVICGNTVAQSDMLTKVKNGLGDRLAAVFAEVKSHTPIEMVARCLEVYRDSGADVLVTVGGGSAIDAGKAIQVMLATGGDLQRYAIRYAPGGAMECQPLPARTIPHIAVPTTAGSASDVMPTAGARDPQSRRKLLFWDDDLTPSATIIDPEMAVHTPAPLTAATGMTAMARAIESLYSGKRHPISTALALHAVRLLRDALPRSVATPHDLDARAACMMASAMSGMAAINAMVSVVHAIGHIVGGRYGLQHGISHAILLAPGMRRLLPVIGSEQMLLRDALCSLDEVQRNPGNAPGSSTESRVTLRSTRATESTETDVTNACAEAIAALVGKLPLPQRLREVGVTEAELPEIAHLTMSDYMMANLPRPMPEDEVLSLLRSVW
jgi:alcohol dehydrogenase class IV